MNQYETMFLFDAAYAADFQQAKGEVERILQRSDAEVVFLEKWDERRLAFEIKGCKRGCYVLTYYNCDPSKIDQIERDCALSEPILRVLVKQADGVTKDQMEGYMPARQEEASHRSEGGSRRDGDDRDRDDSDSDDRPKRKPRTRPTESDASNTENSTQSDSDDSDSAVAVQTEDSDD